MEFDKFGIMHRSSVKTIGCWRYVRVNLYRDYSGIVVFASNGHPASLACIGVEPTAVSGIAGLPVVGPSFTTISLQQTSTTWDVGLPTCPSS